jgi:hypothetical protein
MDSQSKIGTIEINLYLLFDMIIYILEIFLDFLYPFIRINFFFIAYPPYFYGKINSKIKGYVIFCLFSILSYIFTSQNIAVSLSYKN